MSSEFTPIIRRSFIKRSLATSAAISQPVFLAGLLRASGGGGGTGYTKYDQYTTDQYGGFPATDDPYFYQPPSYFDTTFFNTSIVYY